MSGTTPIKEPLRGMLFSLNTCHPGCFCDDDIFEMILQRTPPWQHDYESEDVELARGQIQELLIDNDLPVKEISDQVAIAFKQALEIKSWLRAFSALLDGVQPTQSVLLEPFSNRIKFPNAS